MNKLKKKSRTIRIRQTTKERLDNIAEYLGIKLVDVVDNAIGIYQIKIIKENLKIAEEGIGDIEIGDVIELATTINPKIFRNLPKEKQVQMIKSMIAEAQEKGENQ